MRGPEFPDGFLWYRIMLFDLFACPNPGYIYTLAARSTSGVSGLSCSFYLCPISDLFVAPLPERGLPNAESAVPKGLSLHLAQLGQVIQTCCRYYPTHPLPKPFSGRKRCGIRREARLIKQPFPPHSCNLLLPLSAGRNIIHFSSSSSSVSYMHCLLQGPRSVHRNLDENFPSPLFDKESAQKEATTCCERRIKEDDIPEKGSKSAITNLLHIWKAKIPLASKYWMSSVGLKIYGKLLLIGLPPGLRAVPIKSSAECTQ